MKKLIVIFIILLLLSSIFVSCAQENEYPYFQPLSSLYIPDGVRVVAFGEATHGSRDLKELANEVFKRLVIENDFRAFAIEAPLSNIMAINEYILYGVGTAQRAVAQNGYWVHDFQEVVDLVEWMRDFNLTAEVGDELRFYGYDIQEINVSREKYLAFMRNVDMEKATRDEAAFGSIDTFDTLTIENELLFGYIHHVYKAINEMKQNEEIYVQASSQLEFDFALRNLLGVKWTMEMATILTDTDMSQAGIIPDDFDWDGIDWDDIDDESIELFNFRDKRMYENIKWIVEQEEKRGHGRVFVFGHNMHIAKDLYSDFIPIGEHLAVYFGDEYFAIGTEVYQSTFIAFQVGWRLVEGSITNDTSELINKFIDSYIDIGVVNIRRHIEANGRMGEILSNAQLMSSVGSVFHHDAPLRAYQHPVIPAASYDAIIFVRYDRPARFVE